MPVLAHAHAQSSMGSLWTQKEKQRDRARDMSGTHRTPTSHTCTPHIMHTQSGGVVTIFEKDEKEFYRRARSFTIENNPAKVK